MAKICRVLPSACYFKRGGLLSAFVKVPCRKVGTPCSNVYILFALVCKYGVYSAYMMCREAVAILTGCLWGADPVKSSVKQKSHEHAKLCSWDGKENLQFFKVVAHTANN